MTHFSRFAAVDWSGAKGSWHRGIALAVCESGTAAPVLITPPRGTWSRTEILEWLGAQNRGAQNDALLIGFDFSFAPPFVARGSYLPGDDVPETGRDFWAYVDSICGDEDFGAASLLEQHHRRHFYFGAADGPKADYMHLRACEAHYNAQGGGKPSTIYDVIGAAQVAKASFSGMRLLHQLGSCFPIWPFDSLPDHGSCIIEIYTQIAARASGLRKGISKIRDADGLDKALAMFDSAPHTPLRRYTDHATDAIVTAAWLRANAHRGELWQPPALSPKIARTEGWTFGVV